jgi:hypothetical protein
VQNVIKHIALTGDSDYIKVSRSIGQHRKERKYIPHWHSNSHSTNVAVKLSFFIRILKVPLSNLSPKIGYHNCSFAAFLTARQQVPVYFPHILPTSAGLLSSLLASKWPVYFTHLLSTSVGLLSTLSASKWPIYFPHILPRSAGLFSSLPASKFRFTFLTFYQNVPVYFPHCLPASPSLFQHCLPASAGLFSSMPASKCRFTLHTACLQVPVYFPLFLSTSAYLLFTLPGPFTNLE